MTCVFIVYADILVRVSSDLSFEARKHDRGGEPDSWSCICAVHVRVHVHVQLNCNSAMFCSALHCCPHSSYSPCAKPTQK